MDEVREVVLTGAGKVLCAGADLKGRAATIIGPGNLMAHSRRRRECFHAIRECPKPVICALNGVALGSGLAMAASSAFELKTRASLQLLEGEVPALESSNFGIGHLTLVCALGYLDYRFDSLGWRDQTPRRAAWFAQMQQRPSVAATQPVDG